MEYQEHQHPREHSVLDGLQFIGGLPKNKRRSAEQAKANENSARSCRSVLDGPQCIGGMPKRVSH